MKLHLEGKTALITGGSKGIGLASAKTLAEEGAEVILVARNPETLSQAADWILAETGKQVQSVALDVADPTAPEQLVTQFPEVDILVNNAGAIPGGALDQVDANAWRASWDLKVFGIIEMTRSFHAAMVKRQSGVIVNVIGWAGLRVDANYLAGSMGNASLIAMTRALGSTSPKDGIRVVAVNPGPVDTDRLEVLQRKQAETHWGDAERWPELVAKLPFGRAAKKEEIAAAVAFLVSELSGYTSGAVLEIDGGLSWKM
ncbi:short-chain dehydrogenase/reductase [Marinovum sp. 2_MG-2023]|uniref:short-chain dehydrogenase/reductase n=1 Tax=unclassified Marinovum TaxID=2647166 RepID=UPI0026E33E28|nr:MULTISPECIES: short-chain dehydrogenase/reductase [unclassified Marinovum]MDO6732893.1 short-chain dehydrogenase/reductase [Marinovum sp. 2_MG-2023]MDO6782177.1 short-chain dehydrogenase/reductase [Marinovum sp. 1_MG-2023]